MMKREFVIYFGKDGKKALEKAIEEKIEEEAKRLKKQTMPNGTEVGYIYDKNYDYIKKEDVQEDKD